MKHLPAAFELATTIMTQIQVDNPFRCKYSLFQEALTTSDEALLGISEFKRPGCIAEYERSKSLSHAKAFAAWFLLPF